MGSQMGSWNRKEKRQKRKKEVGETELVKSAWGLWIGISILIS